MTTPRPSRMRRPGLLILAVSCLAPTPGDIGGCGQTVEDLDPAAFFAQKAALDCQACRECGWTTERCAEACGGDADQQTFPEGCFPLVHDGEVCLRALQYSSCDDYESYVSDAATMVPTECDFCPSEGQ